MGTNLTDWRRQIDHVTERCVGIGGIACAAKAILPKNNMHVSYAIKRSLVIRESSFPKAET